jgi:predicted DNA-binding protein (MmcQ/YjbR family)
MRDCGEFHQVGRRWPGLPAGRSAGGSVALMKRVDAVAYCLSKPGAFLDSPWGPDHHVAKVGGKIFCFFGAVDRGGEQQTVTVKNTAEVVDMWRDRFPDHIGTGPYLNKALWNLVVTTGRRSPGNDDVRELIDDSYALVVASLPKSKRPVG